MAATRSAAPGAAGTRGGSRGAGQGGRRPHLLFALGILVITGIVLAVLYLVLGERTAPSAYPGLNGFPKVGTLPSKTTGDVVTFVFAFLVGFLIQRSRWCNASAIRDAILFKSFRNTKPLVAAMAVITAMFTIFEVINVGQPIRIAGGMFTVLGLFLFGIGMVLGGACTVSVWIRSAEGSVAALWALIYTFVGMFAFSELWNVLRWPAASYLQSTSPNLSVLSFGSFNAISIRDAFGPVMGPVAVAVAGAAQVAILILIYRKFGRVERAARAVQVAAAPPAEAASAAAPAMADVQAVAGSAQPSALAAAGPALDAAGPAAPGEPEPDADRRSVELPAVGHVLVDRVLDCSGEMCPRPQLFTKRVVAKEMAVGQLLELVVDNPSSPDLIPTIMHDIGAAHLHTVRVDGNWKLYIRKERDLTTSEGRTGR